MTADEIRVLLEFIGPSLLIGALAPMRRAGRSLSVWRDTLARVRADAVHRDEMLRATELILSLGGCECLQDIDLFTDIVVDTDLPVVPLVLNTPSGVWLFDVRAWHGHVTFEEAAGGAGVVRTHSRNAAVAVETYPYDGHLRLAAVSDRLRSQLPQCTSVHTAILVPDGAVLDDFPLHAVRPATLCRVLHDASGVAVGTDVLLEEVYTLPSTKARLCETSSVASDFQMRATTDGESA